jgi:hypothetical protein
LADWDLEKAVLILFYARNHNEREDSCGASEMSSYGDYDYGYDDGGCYSGGECYANGAFYAAVFDCDAYFGGDDCGARRAVCGGGVDTLDACGDNHGNGGNTASPSWNYSTLLQLVRLYLLARRDYSARTAWLDR